MFETTFYYTYNKKKCDLFIQIEKVHTKKGKIDIVYLLHVRLINKIMLVNFQKLNVILSFFFKTFRYFKFILL